jgi:two-component system, NarL family, response regulator NreC
MRILVADDSDIVRRGIIDILSAGREWNVCGEARNGSEAMQKAHELQPDLVLLDVSMPDISGLEIARRLRSEMPTAKILVISQHDPTLLLPHVIAAGGDACLDKGNIGRDLLATIKTLF